MGAFVLGILVGWLAEWLFYTFWVKPGEDNGNCSSIKAELELKNRQISSLQSQLTAVSKSTADKASSASKAAASSSSQKSTKQAALSSDSKSSSKTKPSKPVAVKTTTIKKAPTTKKTATKTSAKSPTDKTVAPIKLKTKAGGDDFTKLSGIGPSMSATLKTLGIDTFQKLAETDDDILRDMLEASGARMNNNKEAMDSWNEQATVAALGDLKALKAMQAELKR